MVEDAIADFGKEEGRKEVGRIMTRLSLEGCPCFEVVPLAPSKIPKAWFVPSPGNRGGELRRQETAKKGRIARFGVGRIRDALD